MAVQSNVESSKYNLLEEDFENLLHLVNDKELEQQCPSSICENVSNVDINFSL